MTNTNLTNTKCVSSSVIEISSECLNFEEDLPNHCFPGDEEFPGFRKLVGSFCAINGFIGIIGNLLTILAISLATKKNK